MSNKVVMNKAKLGNLLEVRELNGVLLIGTAGFWRATTAKRKTICNGCGPSSWKSFVPDTMYGLRVTDACDIHDWMYHHGKTERDRKLADRIFQINLNRIIDQKSGWWLTKKLRRARAYVYFLAVCWFGYIAFWKGKPDNERSQ